MRHGNHYLDMIYIHFRVFGNMPFVDINSTLQAPTRNFKAVGLDILGT